MTRAISRHARTFAPGFGSPSIEIAARMISAPRTVRAARGTELSCLGWPQEAALRMLCNNLDPEVAERPDDLVVYGGNGRAARSWEAFDAIARALRTLEERRNAASCKAASRSRYGRRIARAPRVLIANSNLVPKWADWTTFRELEAQGLTMYGQMTAGSWIYIGTQGIVQGTYETFAELARQHFGGSLKGRVCLTAGIGGMGGAQPLAITMNDGVALVVDVDRARLDRRRELRYLDRVADSRDEALREVERAKRAGEALSIGYEGNAAVEFPQLYDLGFRPDAVTDQTSAHDLIDGYVPAGVTLEEAAALAPDRSGRIRASRARKLRRARGRDGALPRCRRGRLRLRQQHPRAGAARRFCSAPSRFRDSSRRSSGRCSAADPGRFVCGASPAIAADIARCDQELLRLFPHDASLLRWLELARERVAYQGLPARICWLGYGDRAKAGLAFNELVRTGEVKAPIVIGRDHLDTGSVASPYRETEAMKDGSDAIADWPILNALLNTAAGAHWVSFHHGGGVGIGYSLHAGMVVVADGSDDARERLDTRARRPTAEWVSCATPTPGTNSRSKPPTRRASIGASDRSRADDRDVRYGDAPQCGVDFERPGLHRDGAVLLARTIACWRSGRATEVEATLAGRRRRANSIWATPSSFRVWSTRTRIRSSPATASRISRRGCAAKRRRSAWRTRSNADARRRCSIPAEFYGGIVAPALAHDARRTARRRSKPRPATRCTNPAKRRCSISSPRIATMPASRVSSPRFWARTRCRPSLRRRSASSTISIDQVVPAAAAHGAVYADAFCEPGFFSPDETRRYLDAARLHGMRLRVALRRNGLRRRGGDGRAARGGCRRSLQLHRRCRRSRDCRARHRDGRMPGHDRVSRFAAPRAGARAAGSGRQVALASDYNPGTSPCFNLQTVAYFARKLFGLSAAEALYGVTRAAARSLRSRRRQHSGRRSRRFRCAAD